MTKDKIIWDGKDYPPVGVECLMQDRHDNYGLVKIMYISQCNVVVTSMSTGVEFSTSPKSCIFLPKPSPDFTQFKKELITLCKKFDISIYHEDLEGSLVFSTSFSDSNERYILEAMEE